MILYHFTAGDYLAAIAKHGLTVGECLPISVPVKGASECGSLATTPAKGIASGALYTKSGFASVLDFATTSHR
jgi:hypothetical protein